MTLLEKLIALCLIIFLAGYVDGVVRGKEVRIKELESRALTPTERAEEFCIFLLQMKVKKECSVVTLQQLQEEKANGHSLN